MLFKLITEKDVNTTVGQFTDFATNVSQIILHTAHDVVQQTIEFNRTQLNSVLNPLICTRMNVEELNESVQQQVARLEQKANALNNK